MRVQRYGYRRRGPGIIGGCGCLGLLAACGLAAVVGVLVVVPLLPSIGLRLAGFSPKGDTRAVFADVTSVPPVVPQPSPVVPTQVTINLGTQGEQTVPPNSEDYTITMGDGGQVMQATVTEAGLMDLCRQLSPICRNENPVYQNVRIDLRPGGAVVYGDVSLPELPVTQAVGLVLKLDSSSQQFTVVGIDLNGQLFSVPPSFSQIATDAQRVGNLALHQLVVEAEGGQYTVSEVYADDDKLTLILR